MNKEIIKKFIEEKKEFLTREFGINTIALFGSYSQNIQNINSDIDLLVEFAQIPGLIKFFSIQDYFENLFNKKVDLVTLKALKKEMRKEILMEAVYL